MAKIEMESPSTLVKLEAQTTELQQKILGFEDSSDEDLDSGNLEFPYDPDKIRVDSKVFPVFQIKSMIDRNQLELKPEFQRNTVWDDVRKSRLIESLMLRIPIPAFYFDEDNDGRKTVIDGLQRLSAIDDYMNDKFLLHNLQYLQKECGEKRFSDLQQKYRTRIEDSQLTVNILAPQSPTNVKFDIFRRVNTGGIPLNAQEIRNILATETTRHFLHTLSNCDDFLIATRNRVSDIRMDAQELCLRFITFYLRYNPSTHQVEKLKSMGYMLDQCIESLNQMAQSELDQLFQIFQESMQKCRALFGEKAFSKQDNEHIINKVLFTSWAVVLSSCPLSLVQLEALQSEAIRRLYNRLNQDPAYFTSISSSTGSKTSINKQFETAYQLMEELTHATTNSNKKL